MALKLLVAILMVSCCAGCISTHHYEADILGRWMFTDPKYSTGIQFLENGVCYRLNRDLTRGDVCQYELRKNIIYVPLGCISNGFGSGCSFWEYHYLPAENRLNFVAAKRGSSIAFTPLEKLDY